MNFRPVPLTHLRNQFDEMLMITNIVEDRSPLNPTRRHMVPQVIEQENIGA